MAFKMAGWSSFTKATDDKKIISRKKPETLIQGIKDYVSEITGGQTSREKEKINAQKKAFMANWEKMSEEERNQVPAYVRKTFGV